MIENATITLVIDPITRTIKPKYRSTKSVYLAKGDKDSVVIAFEMPKNIDDNNTAEEEIIHIHYANIGKNGEASKGVSEACEKKTEGDTLVFGWLVPNKATKYAGVLSVGVTLEGYERVDDEVQKVYSWSTVPFGKAIVRDSLDCDIEAVDDEYDYLVGTCNAIVKEAISGNINAEIKTEFDRMKENGEFNVELTEENKQDIINSVLEALPVAEGVGF